MSHERGEGTGNKPDGNEGDLSKYLVLKAVNTGMHMLAKDHPLFKPIRGGIEGFLNKDAVPYVVEDVAREISEQERKRGKLFSHEVKVQKMYDAIVIRARNGDVLNEDGKETLLLKSLEEKAKHGIKYARVQLKEENELERDLTAFKEVYTLLANGDYSHHMEDVAGVLQEFDKMHFAYAAARTLLNRGKINEREYKDIVRGLRHKSKEYGQHVHHAIRQYSGLERAASALLGIAGIGIILASSTGITANVIGYSTFNPEWGGIALGILFTALSSLILFKNRNKQRIT